MAFQVITDPDRLRELGKARLLWYYMHSVEEWRPSVNARRDWEEYSEGEMTRIAARKDYAILLEE